MNLTTYQDGHSWDVMSERVGQGSSAGDSDKIEALCRILPHSPVSLLAFWIVFPSQLTLPINVGSAPIYL